MVLGVLTTKASTNEIANLAAVLDTADLPENIPLKADKGYPSAKNKEFLKMRKLKNHILKKLKKGYHLGSQKKDLIHLLEKHVLKYHVLLGELKVDVKVAQQDIEE